MIIINNRKLIAQLIQRLNIIKTILLHESALTANIEINKYTPTQLRTPHNSSTISQELKSLLSILPHLSRHQSALQQKQSHNIPRITPRVFNANLIIQNYPRECINGKYRAHN